MLLMETTRTAVFGVSVIVFMVVNARTSIFMTNKESNVHQFYDPISLTVIVTGLFANFWLGFFGLFIVMSFNNFMTRNLPNAIGAYEKTKILFALVLLNTLTMAFLNTAAFFNIKIKDINKTLMNWFFGVFLSQCFLLYSCWLVHPDIFNKKFNKFKRKVISERMNNNTLYV